MKMLIAALLLAAPLVASAECNFFNTAPNCQQESQSSSFTPPPPEAMENQSRSGGFGAGFKPIEPIPPIGAKNCRQVQMQDDYGRWRWVSVCD